MKNLIDFILQILLPRTCYCCKRDLPASSQAPLCPECLSKLKPLRGLICKRCGVLLPHGGGFCFDCRGSKAKKFKCKMVRSSLTFNEPLRSLVHAYKYSGHLFIKNFFAPFLIESFKNTKEFSDVNLIIPVSLHWLKKRMRGYNQAEILAGDLAKKVKVAMDTKSLKRIKFTKAQAALDKKSRRKNTGGAFECKENMKGKTILLIDDVSTTTFTLDACAAALKKAGAKRVYALTLAREL